jgi:hypothetical protein
MNAILLALSVVSANCPDYPAYGPRAAWGWDGSVHNHSGWGYTRLYGHGYYPPAVFAPSFTFQPLPNAWNSAVAELRASGPSRSRDRLVSPAVADSLRRLESQRDELYAALVAAPKDEKAELRQQLIVARQELERARILASKELYRGPRRSE